MWHFSAIWFMRMYESQLVSLIRGERRGFVDRFCFSASLEWRSSCGQKAWWLSVLPVLSLYDCRGAFCHWTASLFSSVNKFERLVEMDAKAKILELNFGKNSFGIFWSHNPSGRRPAVEYIEEWLPVWRCNAVVVSHTEQLQWPSHFSVSLDQLRFLLKCLLQLDKAEPRSHLHSSGTPGFADVFFFSLFCKQAMSCTHAGVNDQWYISVSER